MKPTRLYPGDTIATISSSWGCAGASDIRWRYDLGASRLQELSLRVLASPNSLRGERFLEQNPQARADDLMWAFENQDVKAIIANIGGNDSHLLLPYLSADSISRNQKIFCGYSDITTLHLYCHKAGLSTFYGDNLLTTIAELESWHPYSKHWFKKTLFDPAPLGEISHSTNWSADSNQLSDSTYAKHYTFSEGYMCIQGSGVVRGKLFGGNGETLMENSELLSLKDFDDRILFIEDLPETWNAAYVKRLFSWLGNQGYLKPLKGILLGKFCSLNQFIPYAQLIRTIVSEYYSLPNIPILYGLNFGHTSPICMLPYDAQAEIDTTQLRFSIIDSGVI